jgi:hypothetical protein
MRLLAVAVTLRPKACSWRVWRRQHQHHCVSCPGGGAYTSGRFSRRPSSSCSCSGYGRGLVDLPRPGEPRRAEGGMRAAVCVGDAHVRGRGAVFTSWHARGPGHRCGRRRRLDLWVDSKAEGPCCACLRLASEAFWIAELRLRLQCCSAAAGWSCSRCVILALFTLPRRADLAWAHIELAAFPSACLLRDCEAHCSCTPSLLPTLNCYTQLEHNMDAAIDLSDASKALDLSNIRFQLMYGPSHLFVTLC